MIFVISKCRIDGDILTMLSIGQEYVLITTELPLQRLVTQKSLAESLG